MVRPAERRTFPRGAPHQFRHWIPTKTRPCADSRRVGLPDGHRWAFIRTVSTGSTVLRITRVTRLGACGRAHARLLGLTRESVPRSDWVAPWRLPLSRRCDDLQRASAADVEAPLAAVTPSAQAAITASRFMPSLKHRPL